MKYYILYFVLSVFTFTSCKKTDLQPIQKSESKSFLRIKPVANVVQQLYSKVDLQPVGNGVYSGLYKGFQITVNGISYKIIDDYGNSIPVRDGDKIYASSMNTPYSNSGATVSIGTDGSNLENHFSITYGVLSGGNGGPDDVGYHAAVQTAFSNYSTAYNTWSQTNKTTPPPQMNTPWVKDFLTFTGWSPSFQTTTGKLIRSNTGTSTFALATEDYPELAPPSPPAQFLIGYWLSGSTRIYVFVNNTDHTQVVKGSIGTVNSTLYNATGTFNTGSTYLSNFSMSVTSGGTTTPYTYTGYLADTP